MGASEGRTGRKPPPQAATNRHPSLLPGPIVRAQTTPRARSAHPPQSIKAHRSINAVFSQRAKPAASGDCTGCHPGAPLAPPCSS
jgi:hypothetical protein